VGRRAPQAYLCRQPDSCDSAGAGLQGVGHHRRFGELDMLVPAYAVTIHKSQGSEYPAVVIPVMTQHYAMLQRNLLYAGITRGKGLVVPVGQKKAVAIAVQAVAIAVRNVSGRRRWSKLSEWLAPPQGARDWTNGFR
jgi:UvrD-like helicase C-terminal domain